jgi:NADPH-dependent curcumin reductase CurA
LCGVIAHYNDTALPDGPDRLGLLTRTLLIKRIKMQGFIIFDDYGHRFGEFFAQMSLWLANGQIKFKEDVVNGLENAPQAFIGLLEGRNFGKLIVQVAQD